MSQNWFNKIKDAVFPVLLEQQAKSDCEYSEDLVAYSANGKRCVHIYDNYANGGYEYLLIASTKINDQWGTGEVLEFNGHDGIDVMCQVEMYLTRL